MRLPSMKYADGIRKGQQVQFGGLNMSRGAADGELCTMKNMTGDHYPLLATRAPRLYAGAVDEPSGLFAWEKLAWVDGTDFYFDGVQRGQVAPGEKVFASLGAYIVIMPDKCYYNVDTGEFGSMEAEWTGESLTFSDGLLYGQEAMANAISCEGVQWSDHFRSGDAVTISGCTQKPENNKSIIIRAIDGDKLYFYENSFTLGEEGEAYTEKGKLRISRTMPQLLYLCENENRLWGCTENSIYASKLGDIFNWNVFDGLDTDSYAVDTGSAGAFTGCVSYGGYPVFFKEEHIYKVYGSIPSNFSVIGSATLGLARGSHKSLAVAGEILFYLSRSGVMAYTGGVPQPMGAAFGTKRYKNAVGGSDGLKYYISMEDGSGAWSLFVYDTQQGLWHREDETKAVGFARHGGNLYCLTSEGQLFITGNAQQPPEDAITETGIEWEAEFADFTEKDPNKKGVSKIQIRLELEAGASAQVWIMFDSDGNWKKVGSAMGEDVKRSYYLPIVPRRSDHYRLKITGYGSCRIYSIAREYYHGSAMKSRMGGN